MTILYGGGLGPRKRRGLTMTQRAYLDEIRAAGTRTYNGRARSALRALEAAGHILLEEHLDLRSDEGLPPAWVLTATWKGEPT